MGEANIAKGDELRGDGKLKPIFVEGENLAHAAYNAIIACHDYGARVETPKYQKGETLGYDAPMIVHVRDVEAEPKIYTPSIVESARGLVQYILEVTHGIHNHWLKSPEHPDRWGYTYNGRFVDQIPFILRRIKAEWDEKKAKGGEGRITGRDYQFDIWRAGEDIILEQPDAPCFQRGSFRFLKNSKGQWVMNYNTTWRSRDLLKAWNENNHAQIGCKNMPGLMMLFRDKVSDMLGIPIELGAYNDISDSLHIYSMYIDRDHFEEKVANMKGEHAYPKMTMSLEDYLLSEKGYFTKDEKGMLTVGRAFDDVTSLKRFVAAQDDATAREIGMNLSAQGLYDAGYDLEKFSYPSDWDRWPASWDAEPNPQLLARVLDARKISLGRAAIDRTCKNGFASPEELNALAELGKVLK